jgi:hypothetical protein
MLAPKIVTEVRRLLAEGEFSYRDIARLTGISRGSVGAIASGKRSDRQPHDELETPTGPAVRCPGCGGKVYMPCLLCQVRNTAKKPRSALGRNAVRAAELPDLNLRPEHRARYEELRARRIGRVLQDSSRKLTAPGG